MVRHNLVGAFCRCRFYPEKQRDGKRLGDRAERRDPSRYDSRLAGVKPGMRSKATPKARSRARLARQRVPSSKRRPSRVTPWGTRRGGENFGNGFCGSGAQSERASETSTKPARSVSEGWPVLLLMVSISSRSEGTSSRSTSEKMRAISWQTLRRKRSVWTKSTAERKRAWRKRLGQESCVCILS